LYRTSEGSTPNSDSGAGSTSRGRTGCITGAGRLGDTPTRKRRRILFTAWTSNAKFSQPPRNPLRDGRRVRGLIVAWKSALALSTWSLGRSGTLVAPACLTPRLILNVAPR